MMKEMAESMGKRERSPDSSGSREKKRGRSRSASASAAEVVKDICACVRLTFYDEEGIETTKWLRLKIPAILFDKLPSPSLDSDSDSSSTEYDPYVSNLRNWDDIICKVDLINGPFDFTPLGPYEDYHPPFARCAAIGSIIYSLGGYIRPLVRDAVFEGVIPKQRLITGSPITGGRPPQTQTRTRTQTQMTITDNDNDTSCYHLHFCDFSKQDPKWEISPDPILRPRLKPKLLSVDGKIYAFGGYPCKDEESPFGEVYDPKLGFWEPLPKPPFGPLSDSELHVLPLPPPSSHHILVLGSFSKISYQFDIHTWIWSPFDPYASKRLARHLHGVRFGTSPVIFHDTIYWIHRAGILFAYKLGTPQAQVKGKLYKGLITGFEGLPVDSYIKEDSCYPLTLLPISKHLLGLLYCDLAPLAQGFCVGSTLHFTILRVSFHKEIELEPDTDSEPEVDRRKLDLDNIIQETDPFLTASVVASLTFPFPMDNIDLVDAYLIDDDEESWKLMTSCSSYCSIVSKAGF